MMTCDYWWAAGAGDSRAVLAGGAPALARPDSLAAVLTAASATVALASSGPETTSPRDARQQSCATHTSFGL
jgi:hypothetical protein